MPNITFTTNEFRVAFEALDKLSQTKLPIKASYWVSRLLAKWMPEYQASEKARNSLVQELGEQNEQGYFLKTDHPNWKMYQERYTELMGVEVEVDAPQIPLVQFGAIDIEPAFLLALDKLIVETPQPA